MKEREEKKKRIEGGSDLPNLSSCLVLSPASAMVLGHASCPQPEGSCAGHSLCGHRHC